MIVFLTIFFGSLLLPPIVETFYLHLGRRWSGSVIGAFSVFLLWLLVFLLHTPKSSYDPFAQEHVLGTLLLLGSSFYIAISYFIFSLGLHAAINYVSRAMRVQKPVITAYFRPWLSMGMLVAMHGSFLAGMAMPIIIYVRIHHITIPSM